jgi:hypothetical protein
MGSAAITPEGWVVIDVDAFRFVADHQPPRPSAYRFLLWEDARSWKPLALWISVAGFGAAGLASIRWLSLPVGAVLLCVGAFLLWFWFVLFRSVGRDLCHSSAGVGVVEALSPHPLLRDHSTATALTPEGQKVPITLPTRLVDAFIDADGRAEVFFLQCPGSQFSLGLAARAVKAERSAASVQRCDSVSNKPAAPDVGGRLGTPG